MERNQAGSTMQRLNRNISITKLTASSAFRGGGAKAAGWSPPSRRNWNQGRKLSSGSDLIGLNMNRWFGFFPTSFLHKEEERSEVSRLDREKHSAGRMDDFASLHITTSGRQGALFSQSNVTLLVNRNDIKMIIWYQIEVCLKPWQTAAGLFGKHFLFSLNHRLVW